MQYTLDSVTLVLAALKDKFPNKEYISKPIFINDLDKHFDNIGSDRYDTSIFYFGRLTIGDTPSSEGVRVYTNEVQPIVLDSNSQITLLFNDLEPVDSGLMRGQFVGFRIIAVS